MAAALNQSINVIEEDENDEEAFLSLAADEDSIDECNNDGDCDEQPNVLDKFKEYMQDTSAHGIVNILQAVTLIGRFCWLLCVLTSFGIFFWQTSALTMYFLSNPVYVARRVSEYVHN